VRGGRAGGWQRRRHSLGFASAFALVLFSVGWLVGSDDPDFNLVYQIISEYLIGLSALALVKVLEYYEIYPMVGQCDEWCYPWAGPGGAATLKELAAQRDNRPGLGSAYAGGSDDDGPNRLDDNDGQDDGQDDDVERRRSRGGVVLRDTTH